jgi:hypothetical protein
LPHRRQGARRSLIVDHALSYAQEAGVDVRVADIGGAIEEVMSSYEVEINDDKGQRILPGACALLAS